MRIIAELWDTLVVKVVATIVAPLILALFYFAGRRLYRAFHALHLVEAARRSVAREKNDGIWEEAPGFWLRLPIRKPANYHDLGGNSIPILMIAATKGGVGKTSLAGSLAAHFAMKWKQKRQDPNRAKPLRVLVIDQDFQGSFSTMSVDANRRFSLPSKANSLVTGELGEGRIRDIAEPISQTGMVTPLSIWTIPAYYDLAQAENRMLIEWLLPLSDQNFISKLLRLLRIRDSQPSTADKDVRYLLAEALLHPQVQKSFDLIIIDSPPRLTTSHIQGMCAATHLLVPTILDGLSGDAVARYLDQVATHKLGPPNDARRAISPHLQPIGIVCMMVPRPTPNLTGPLGLLESRIAAGRIKPDIVPQNCFVGVRPPYREHAGERIAYAATSNDQQHQQLRGEVDQLGQWLAPKLGAVTRGWI